MTSSFVRYRSELGAAWGLVDAEVALPLPAEYRDAAHIMNDPHAADAAREAKKRPLALADLTVLAPLVRSRVLCQGANYRSHMRESGMDPERSFNMLFTKSTASLSGPFDDIVRPAHVRLLDYEVELGLVLRASITEPTVVTEESLDDFVGGFVIANDVSARDVQMPQGQWYKGKSYRTFCPIGPYLVVPGAGQMRRWRELRLRLSVNGETRQDCLSSDMMFTPAATLTEWSHLEDLAAGDLLLTGTPSGVAMQPPPAVVQRIAGLLSERQRWRLFIKGQASRRTYLQTGDIVEASIYTDDRTIDLGTQQTRVR